MKAFISVNIKIILLAITHMSSNLLEEQHTAADSEVDEEVLPHLTF